MHLTKPLRQSIAANAGWLTVFQLPTYAPDLNPREGIWSLVKRDIGNLAATLAEITRQTPAQTDPVLPQPDRRRTY